MKRTDRGFAIYAKLTDTYGADVRVQKSSAAGVRRCWIFAKGGSTLGSRQKTLSEESPMQPGENIVNDSVSAHLSPAQARRVAKALLQFADGDE